MEQKADIAGKRQLCSGLHIRGACAFKNGAAGNLAPLCAKRIERSHGDGAAAGSRCDGDFDCTEEALPTGVRLAVAVRLCGKYFDSNSSNDTIRSVWSIRGGLL